MATRKRKGPQLGKSQTKKRRINTSNSKSNARQSNGNQRRRRRVVLPRRRRPGSSSSGSGSSSSRGHRTRHIQAPRSSAWFRNRRYRLPEFVGNTAERSRRTRARNEAKQMQSNANRDMAMALRMQQREQQMASNAQMAQLLANGQNVPRMIEEPRGGETKQIRENVNVNRDMARALQMQEQEQQMALNAQMAQQLANGQNQLPAPHGRDNRGRRMPQRTRRRSRTPPRGTTRRRRNTGTGVGTGGIISGITGLATRAVGYINPFSALWRAFTGCRRERGTDVCQLPENESDLPPIEIQTGEDGYPYLNELIPGTQFTFQQLRDAMRPNNEGGKLAEGRDACAVHAVMARLTNGHRVFQILNQFADNNPQWQAYNGTASGEDIIYLLGSFLTRLTQNSERIYRNSRAIRNIVNAAGSLFHQNQTFQIGGQSIAARDFVLLFIFFVGSMPPRMQQRWAENLIRDSIEAYDTRLETYNGAGPISCPRGIVERMFLGLHGELMQARENIIDESARKQHAAFKAREEARKRASQKRGEGKGHGSRHKMVENWTQQHFVDQGGEMNAKGVREYIQSKINSNDDYHNTQEEWDQTMHNYFTDEMLNALMIERDGKSWDNISKGGKRRYKKKKTKKSKKRHRKKTRKAGKKK